MTRFVDAAGRTVEAAVIDGVACFIPRGPRGHVLGQSLGVARPLPTTPAELEALGIDLATLKEVAA